MTDQGTIWLTQEAYDKLKAELEDLRGPKRQEIIERISAARDLRFCVGLASLLSCPSGSAGPRLRPR